MLYSHFVIKASKDINGFFLHYSPMITPLNIELKINLLATILLMSGKFYEEPKLEVSFLLHW